jgi:hypothetical protein
MKKARLVLAGVVLLVLVVLTFVTVLAARGNVPTWARDLNCDGRVSIAEWYEAGNDHGWRPAVGGPPGCMEVFRFKDGLPDVLWCEQSPRCRPGVH